MLETLSSPRKERALVVLCPDEKSRLEFNITRRRMEAYAYNHSLDFVIINSITTQYHPCGGKYIFSEIAARYKQILWIDTDVIVNSSAPNIFNLVPEDHWGLVEEPEYIKTQNWFIKEWNEAHKYWRVPFKPISRTWNSGIAVAPNNAINHYFPPIYPVPAVWCAEQHWHTYCLLDAPVVSLPTIWNNCFHLLNWERQSKRSWFNHICGCHPHSLRLKILELMDKEQQIPQEVWPRPTIKCTHLDTDDTCLIIKQLTGEEHYPSQEECVACSKCHDPKTVNEITSALSNKILVELDRPTLYKIGHGPGTRLKKTISWFIDKDTCDGCEEKSKIMDAWGVAGCKRNTKTIVHWLTESAHLNNITTTRIAIEMIVFVLLNTPYRTPEKAS